MAALQLGIMPTDKGVVVFRKAQSDCIFVIEDKNRPRFWYSIDPVTKGPAAITAELRREAASITRPGNEVQGEGDMRVFTHSNFEADPAYEETFFRYPNYRLTLTSLYWDKLGNVGVAVKGDEQLDRVYRGHSLPHIGLAKAPKTHWTDVGALVELGERALKGWVQNELGGDGVFFHQRHGLYKKALNWVTVGAATTHLQPSL